MKKIKIVDNVDLKELEKFGFHKVDGSLGFCSKEVKYNDFDEMDYFVNTNTRIIEINTYDGGDEPLDSTLYDLIKADLVEVVEDE